MRLLTADAASRMMMIASVAVASANSKAVTALSPPLVRTSFSSSSSSSSLRLLSLSSKRRTVTTTTSLQLLQLSSSSEDGRRIPSSADSAVSSSSRRKTRCRQRQLRLRKPHHHLTSSTSSCSSCFGSNSGSGSSSSSYRWRANQRTSRTSTQRQQQNQRNRRNGVVMMMMKCRQRNNNNNPSYPFSSWHSSSRRSSSALLLQRQKIVRSRLLHHDGASDQSQDGIRRTEEEDNKESDDVRYYYHQPNRFAGKTVCQAVWEGWNEMIRIQQQQQQQLTGDDTNDENDQNNDYSEAEESVIHILSHVLDLDWDTGYRELREILHSYQQQRNQSNNNNDQEEKEGSNDVFANSERIRNIAPLLLSTSSYSEDRTLTEKESYHFSDLLERHITNHEPIQYLVGKWDFSHCTFQIRPPLLCPRPETEELVELVHQHIIQQQELQQQEQNQQAGEGTRRPINILDVGCGTGCIGISLAHMLNHQQQEAATAAVVHAIDIEPVAIETSLENAKAILGHDNCSNGLYSAELVSAQDYEVNVTSLYGGYDYVVSNPPYILPSDMKSLPSNVQHHESRDALCGGKSEDGMDVIRTIVQKLPQWCRCNRHQVDDTKEEKDINTPSSSYYAYCFMEVDPTHPALLKKWLNGSSCSSSTSNPPVAAPQVELVDVYKDFCGRDRFVQLRIKR